MQGGSGHPWPLSKIQAERNQCFGTENTFLLSGSPSPSIHPPSCTPTAFLWELLCASGLRASVSDEPCYRDRQISGQPPEKQSVCPLPPSTRALQRFQSRWTRFLSLLLDPGPQVLPVSIQGSATSTPAPELLRLCVLHSPGCGLFLPTQPTSSCRLPGRGGQHGTSPLDCQHPSSARSHPDQIYVWTGASALDR